MGQWTLRRLRNFYFVIHQAYKKMVLSCAPHEQPCTVFKSANTSISKYGSTLPPKKSAPAEKRH